MARYRTTRRPRVAPDGFEYVQPTREEVDEWKNRPANRGRLAPRQYRLRCTDCGTRIWGSGLGCGAHRRACPGKPGRCCAHGAYQHTFHPGNCTKCECTKYLPALPVIAWRTEVAQ